MEQWQRVDCVNNNGLDTAFKLHRYFLASSVQVGRTLSSSPSSFSIQAPDRIHGFRFLHYSYPVAHVVLSHWKASAQHCLHMVILDM